MQMISKAFLAASMIGTLMGCDTRPPVAMDPSLDDAGGYTGRVRLTRFLDEPDGYCLDVPGPASNPMLQFPLAAHTCHPDPYEDQVFEFNKDSGHHIRWTTQTHDLCFTADAAQALSKLNLRACDQPALQAFEYTVKRELQLKGTDLCIHVARMGPANMNPPGPGQDAYGRGRPVNPQFTHLLRTLELRQCGDGDPSMSRWQALR